MADAAAGVEQQRRQATTGEQRGTDSQEYLKKEQKELLEAVRERAALREEQDKKRAEGQSAQAVYVAGAAVGDGPPVDAR